MTTVNETWSASSLSDWIGDGSNTVTSVKAGGIQATNAHFISSQGDETTSTEAYSRIETALATADHEASITIGTVSNEGLAQQFGVCVRFAAAASTFYYAIWDVGSNGIYINKAVAGTLTGLAGPFSSGASGDVIKIRATGTSPVALTAYKNGVSVGTFNDSSSPITGNTRTGVYMFVNRFTAQTPSIGAFTATDVTAGGPTYTLVVDAMTINVVLDPVTLTYTPASGTGAYLFGSANTDKIDMGTSISAAATWSLAVRASFTTSASETRILAAVRTASQVNAQIYADSGAADRMNLLISTGSGGAFPIAQWASGGFTAGTTHVFVGTFDGTTLSLYADTDATPKATNVPGAAVDQPASSHLYVGNDGAAATNSAHGKIHEVAWYPNTVLTGAQAAALGGGGQMGIGFPQPTNYYPFNGNANDLFGGQNGTVTGATQVADAATSWFPSAAGGATAVQVGRGSWRGAFRGSNRGGR